MNKYIHSSNIFRLRMYFIIQFLIYFVDSLLHEVLNLFFMSSNMVFPILRSLSRDVLLENIRLLCYFFTLVRCNLILSKIEMIYT